MVRCIIVDDEPLAVAQMEKYVERIPFLENVRSCSSATEAMEILSEENVDVMFVDISMPDISGMQLVRSLSNPPMVVFTTAHSEYAVEGFKVDAVDYLLKPIGFDDFLRAASKVKEMFILKNPQKCAETMVETRSGDSLFVKSDYRIIRVPVDTIMYVESMSEYVRIFVEGQAKPIISLLSMKKVEEALPSDTFMRVHRSYLVNLCKIKEISKMRIVYDNNVYIPIGDMYKTVFFDYVEKHFIGKNS
ncbi:MAG: response regulator transcription factor [Bacteroidaceae bacterium]|nr:response regulator transcription factor [Bacteroidaceae bacterium]